MASTACFVIVGRNDSPIYESEVGTAPKTHIMLVRCPFNICDGGLLMRTNVGVVGAERRDNAFAPVYLACGSGYCPRSRVVYKCHVRPYLRVKGLKRRSCLSQFQSQASVINWFLKVVDRFNDLLVSVYVTAGHTRLMLLHDTRNEDGIKNFFQEVHELYIKILLNPLYVPGSRITSPYFDTRVRALARKYL